MSFDRFDHKELLCTDGTRITYHVGGNPDGQALVLCNGIGSSSRAWLALINRYRDSYKIIGWEYRGISPSGCPKNRDAYSIEPGHDAWVVGDKKASAYEFHGLWGETG